MRTRSGKVLVADFETTVYEGQVNTEVWAAACVELFTEDVKIFHSIGELFDYFASLESNIVCYFHNLKFDGSFWLSYLMGVLGWAQAMVVHGEDDIEFLKPRAMPNNTFSYSISSMGQWYRILIKYRNKIIELRDSLKLLPFTVEKIGKSFKTKHKKLDMEYTGFRFAGCEITDEEKKYIANDVLVVKEAIEIMFQEGHKKLTIGSCCLAEYRQILGNKRFNELFPDVYEIPLDDSFGSPNVGKYINQSYRGGWCYLARGKEQQLKHNGTTADVNSLYPSMMSSESGNTYPVGNPIFWRGNYIPEEANAYDKFYFVRFKTRFYLRPGKLPFIQIKNTLSYRSNEMLESSDRYNPADGKYYKEYYDVNGDLQEARVVMTMTQTDFKLFKEHYELVDFEILDGCYFEARIGIFDEYIEKYKKIKLESTGARRELAKLFLNNLYGKMASSPVSNFKIAYLKENGVVGFNTILANDKKPGYIPVGSAITSYARCFTIRAAQANYYGPDKPGFIYADTDSIHCDLPADQIKGIKVHDKNFCCWKLESSWDDAYFVRQKTYIEHVTHENLEPVDKPYYSVKCAGMPQHCKDLFVMSMTGNYDTELTEEEQDFLYYDKEHTQKHIRTLQDFDIGLCVPGKLRPKTIKGGVLLVDSVYQMR